MVWIPVLLSLLLGPGMGQFYNKEYKKGTYLVVTSLVVFIAAAVWLKNILMPYLPTDLMTEDPTALTLALQQNAHKAMSEHAGALYGYQALLMGLWVYGVIDAYKGARRRQLQGKLTNDAASKGQ